MLFIVDPFSGTIVFDGVLFFALTGVLEVLRRFVSFEVVLEISSSSTSSRDRFLALCSCFLLVEDDMTDLLLAGDRDERSETSERS